MNSISIKDMDHMSKRGRAIVALGSIVLLVGVVTHVALAIYMMLNPYVG